MTRTDDSRPERSRSPVECRGLCPRAGTGSERVREHGLLTSLRDAGRDVHDRGDVPWTRWVADPARADAMNVGAVANTARAVADEVAASVDSGGDVLVLGGDCTIELGTVAGALRSGRSVGLVYIDLDADLKVPGTGEGALDWMGVAHLVDAPGGVDELASLGPSRANARRAGRAPLRPGQHRHLGGGNHR